MVAPAPSTRGRRGSGQWLSNGTKAEQSPSSQVLSTPPLNTPISLQVRAVKIVNMNMNELYAMTQMTTAVPVTSTPLPMVEEAAEVS